MSVNRVMQEMSPTVPGFTNPKVLGLLYSVVVQFQPKTCVEIGSFMGRSASVISLALAALGGGRRLICVDLFDTKVDQNFVQLPLIREIMKYAESSKGQYCDLTRISTIGDCFDLTTERFPHMLENVTKIQCDSASDWNSGRDTFDFSYIDGDHTYEAVKRDALSVMRYANAGHCMVFDDYSTQFPGVVRFVEELKSHQGVEAIAFEHPDIAVTIESPANILKKFR